MSSGSASKWMGSGTSTAVAVGSGAGLGYSCVICLQVCLLWWSCVLLQCLQEVKLSQEGDG